MMNISLHIREIANGILLEFASGEYAATIFSPDHPEPRFYADYPALYADLPAQVASEHERLKASREAFEADQRRYAGEGRAQAVARGIRPEHTFTIGDQQPEADQGEEPCG